LKENLQQGRAAYGKRLLVTVSQELKAEFGDGFSYSSLSRVSHGRIYGAMTRQGSGIASEKVSEVLTP